MPEGEIQIMSLVTNNINAMTSQLMLGEIMPGT
jgi:hypothetical protein